MEFSKGTNKKPPRVGFISLWRLIFILSCPVKTSYNSAIGSELRNLNDLSFFQIINIEYARL